MNTFQRTNPPATAIDTTLGTTGGRRAFLKAAVALGVLSNGLPAHAEAAARVVFGFPLTPAAETMIKQILRDLRSSYRPDLGDKLEYVPGNSGMLAMQAAANAPPDGGTVLLTSSAALTLLPLLYPLPIDPATALQPVAAVCEFAYAFVVGPAVPAEVTTLPAYLRWAQANPSLATYGLPGRGTAPHFLGTEVARLSDVGLKAVGYKGPLPVMKDVVQGSIPAAFTVVPNGSDLAAFANVRTLAVSSPKRWPGHPDTPTLMELKLAESPTVDSLGFFVAAGTPPAKVAELRDAVRLALQSDATIASMRSIGLEPMSPEVSYPDQIALERAEWQKRVEKRHFEADR